MNYVFISPYFPENYVYFCEKLKSNNINVLGIGSENYENLKPELKHALTEYYKVSTMENYDEMLRACGYFTHKYGKIDRIESHNEHWLEQDAKLRADFNVSGYRPDTIISAKRKSEMKEIFKRVGIKTAKGRLVASVRDALEFITTVGYPICIKPDIGVGAANTYKIKDSNDLEDFFVENDVQKRDFIMEEWINGEIVSFDGIADKEGNIIFYGSFFLDTGVMDIVNQDLDVFYYTMRNPDPNLIELGEKAVAEFNIKERFFHIEFFKLEDGSYLGLELNSRPPGGMTVDMYNFSYNMDLYDLYGKMISGVPLKDTFTCQYYTGFVGRKNKNNYLYSIREIQELYKDMIVYTGPVPSIFATAMGDFSFVIRDQDFAKIEQAAKSILEQY